MLDDGMPTEEVQEKALDIMKHRSEPTAKDKMKIKSYIDSLYALQKINHVKTDDLVHIDHWGKSVDGRVIVLDYGFTEKVEREHYQDL
jgi:hypothetical protein